VVMRMPFEPVGTGCESYGPGTKNAPELSGPGRSLVRKSATNDGHRAAVPVEKSLRVT
jgi:hypothetical protein